MNVSVTLTGVVQTQAQLRTLSEAAETLGRLRGVVRTEVPYARYVEHGTRFMPGRFFLRRAASQADLDRLAQVLGAALWKGPAAVRAVFKDALDDILRRAQQNAPVRSGRLRGSLYSRLGSR